MKTTLRRDLLGIPDDLARAVLQPETGDGRVRVLLVICRPRGGEDVPFRSVAGRMIKGLGAEARHVHS